MTTATLFVVQIRWTGLNRVFLVAALIFAVVSVLRRKEPIGGWLLYFYYWIFALLAISLVNVVTILRLTATRLDKNRRSIWH
jgi:hypothetical protein